MRRSSRATVSVLLAAALWAAVAAPAAGAQEGGALNHFFCYEARTAEPRPWNLDVRDQLDQQVRRPVQAVQPVAYCNPASLSEGGRRFDVVDEDDHLTVYEVTSFEPPLERVTVENHLTAGAEILQLEDARWLMVPTRQRAPIKHRAPRRLDHYLCYGVMGGTAGRGEVELEDQFGRWPSTPVGRPLAVCLPAEVRLGRRATSVENPDTPLVCYEVDRPFAASIEGESSFGDEDLSLTRAFTLCVPSARRAR